MVQTESEKAGLDMPLSRRAFTAGSIAAGFTLATGPLNAATINTPVDGLDAGSVAIPVTGRTIGGYRAKPKGKTNLPVMLVVQEVFGVHEWIKDICRRLAHEGYYAIAPSLYDRYGDPLKYTDTSKLMADIVSKVPDAEVMSDLDDALKYAGGDGGDTARTGIIGFCWGGRIVWLYSAHSTKLKAGIACYGRLKGNADPLHPRHPLEMVSELKAPVLGLYGGLDTGILQPDVEAMNAALKAAGKKDSHIDVFPDAQHGFFADYRPSYNEADAKEGWARALAFLRAHGVK
jgi:carboxymethylenebutenolidase